MKKSYKIAAVIAVIVVVWVLTAIIFPGDQKEANDTYKDDKKEVLVSVRVEKHEAKEKAISLTILGLTKAIRKVDLRAETSGLVDEIFALKGSRVRTDDTILKLNLKNRPADLKKAKAALAKAKIDLEAAEKLSRSGVRAKTALAEAQATYEEALANVSAIELDIDNTNIKAPIDGIFHKKEVNIGDFVDVGEKVATILDLSSILVTGSITEANIQDIKLGTIGTARILGGKEHTGVITYKSAIADPKTRTFEIELRISNEDLTVSEGMTAELTIPLKKEVAHFVSPAVLTLSDQGQIGVKIVDENNMVRFKPVGILDHSREGIWLTGLEDEVNLIVVGQEFVTPGQKVKPIFIENKKS